MQPDEESAKAFTDVAERIRSGEFFRESRRMYDFTVHDPMAERYFYLLITGVALFIWLVTVVAVRGLYPLQSSVPFVVSSENLVEDLPRIRTLLTYRGEDADTALMDFLAGNYVKQREEYDIDSFDRNMAGVKAQSADAVAREFERQVDPGNPESPIALYQRHSKRRIAILSSKLTRDNPFGREVIFEAAVEGRNDIKKSRWQATLFFDYKGLVIEDMTDTIKPVSFTVTEYRVKRLQDNP